MIRLLTVLVAVLLAGCMRTTITFPDGTVIKGSPEVVHEELQRRHELIMLERAPPVVQATSALDVLRELIAAIASENTTKEGEILLGAQISGLVAGMGQGNVAAAIRAAVEPYVAQNQMDFYEYRTAKRRDWQNFGLRLFETTGNLALAYWAYDRAGDRRSSRDITQNITLGDGNTLSNSTNDSGLGGEGPGSTEGTSSRNICIGCVGSGLGLEDRAFVSFESEGITTVDQESSAFVSDIDELKAPVGDDQQGQVNTLDDRDGQNEVGLF